MKFLEKLVEIKLRLEVGTGWLYWPRNLIIIMAGIKYLINISGIWMLILGIMAIAGVYILGWMDLNFLKIYQIQQKLQTGKYNPYFVRKLGK